MIEATESNKIANRLQEVDKESRLYKKLYKKIDKVLSNEVKVHAISGHLKCYMSTDCLWAYIKSTFIPKQNREEAIFLTVLDDYIKELAFKGYRIDFPMSDKSYFYIYWD